MSRSSITLSIDDLDALGEVGQFVDRDDAAGCPRDEAVGGVRVTRLRPSATLIRIDVADEVGDARVRGRQLLGSARCVSGWPASRHRLNAHCGFAAAPAMTGVRSSSEADQ